MLENYNNSVIKFIKVIQLTIALFIASIGCTLLLAVRMKMTGSVQYGFLIWNLFLAWVPYFISLFIKYYSFVIKKAFFVKFFVLMTSFVWLVFFPNSSYIFTDFIYILKFNFYIPNKDSFFTPQTLIWFDIVISSSFAFIGHIIGLISLIIMHTVFARYFDKIVSWIIIICAVILSGYGIFLGRFVRLNSWDIFHDPGFVIHNIFYNLFSMKAVLFSFAFSFFIFLTYLIIYFLYQLRK